MRNIEIDDVFAIHPQMLVVDHIVDLARCDIARDQIAIRGVLLFKEIPRLAILVRPDASAFAARRFAHQAILVGPRNGSGMDLDEFAISVERPLRVELRSHVARVDGRVRRLAEDGAAPTRCHHHRVCRECADLHGSEVLRNDALAYAFIEDGRDERPELIAAHHARYLLRAHLLVERVEQLLTGGRTCECGTAFLRATESAQVKKTFRSAIEHDPHAIEKVHDGRSRLAHARHHGLVRQEIAAVDGIVDVLPDRIAFTLGVEHRIDTALCAD